MRARALAGVKLPPFPVDAGPTMTSKLDTRNPGDAAREHAQATVEFAMILPILCLVLFAIVEFGMAFWNYQQVSAAASEGARRAAVSRTYSDRDSRVQAAVEDASPQLTASELSVTTTSTWRAGEPVTVTVSYPQRVRIMGRTFFDQDLRVARTQMVEQ